MTENHQNQEPVEYPVNGVLDLHQFQPGDVKELVPDYLQLCRENGIYEVRIIHGKGTGTLRRTVHAILDRMESEVTNYHLATDPKGGWGATIVYLNPGN